MARKRHTPEQVLAKLRDAEVMQSQGLEVAEIAKKLGVSEQTLHRWRNQYGGMKAEEVKRLKELERENAQFKRLVADQALDIRMLKDLSEGNF
jgi:transposase-like protein